jgi:tetratricopeptide (TPR) repeat protein
MLLSTRAQYISMTESLTLLQLGEVLSTQNRWQEAVEALRRSISLDADSPGPYHHLGDALGKLGQLSDAVTAYEQALALDPERVWTLLNLGNALSKLERWEEAEAAYHSAIRLDATEPLAFLHLGESLKNQGRCEEAVEVFHKSISLDAKNSWPHHHLGDALCKLGRLPEGVTAYEQALFLSPESLWTFRNLGNALAKLGHWEDAELAYQSAARLDANEPRKFLHIGELLTKQDRWEEAAEAFRASISLDAGNSWPHHHLGDALCRLGQLAEAVSAYKQALVLAPESPWTLRNLGNALSKLGRWEEAAGIYRQSLAAVDDDAETCIALGNALAKLERWREAESAYLQARSVTGDDLHVTEALAGVWLKLERWQEAVSAYEQCFALARDNMQLQRNLGIAVFKLETQKAYRKAHPNAISNASYSEDEQLPLPEIDWSTARFGARVFEIERWIEDLIPKFTKPSTEHDDRGECSAKNARLLFILDNDYGELTTLMYLLLGQDWAEHVMVLLPDRLYQTNSQAFPGRTFCFESVADVEQVVDSFRPDIAFLCSGYLYAMHDLFSHDELQYLVDLLVGRDCKVVTADPFLGMLSRQPIASLISTDVPDASDLDLPAHVFEHLASVKREQDELIVEKLAGAERILRNHLHLYPAHASPLVDEASATDPREIACFNPKLICSVALEPDLDTKPHWVFILSNTDFEAQMMFEAVRGFTEIVARLLQQAIALGRRPIFVAPEKFIRALAREMRGHEGAELLSFCAFTRLSSLLLTAEYAFYWNSVSHSILLRSFNGLPVILFDRGHLVRNVEAIYDRIVKWYYQGVQPIYMDHCQPLTLEGLNAATVDFRRSAGQMNSDFQRAPDPEALIERILGATPAGHY